jgi:L-aspartate oxidase
MNRYLIDFDTEELDKKYYDVVIVGGGIAGVYTALEIPEKYNIAILTKEGVDISSSVLAQGGIAVSLDKSDSPDIHMQDTLYAGAGLCDEESVRVLVDEAAENINLLCKYGVEFDRSPEDKRKLALTREGAHSKNRIIHAGDATGKEVCDKLIYNVTKRSNVIIYEKTWALDLLVKDGACHGLIAMEEETEKPIVFYADAVICATGGYGQLYYYTTNPVVATGDGAAFTFRAGGELEDLEFVQFHPTVLYHPENKSFLISEAVRGEGAILRNAKGERFMPNYHELAELAPRDVVSRCIFMEMKKTGTENVYLDITHEGKEYLEKRFPNIYSTLQKYGMDMSKDHIPVAPAEHYCMGGIKTNLDGETNIINYYACGEAACTGIHGANRLASNSLLEGIVFGRRIALKVSEMLMNEKNNQKHHARFFVKTERMNKGYNSKEAILSIKQTMTELVGIERTYDTLNEALQRVVEIKKEIADMNNTTFDDYVLQNMVLLAELVIKAAIMREESRGAHYRSDFKETKDEWKVHIVFSKDNIVREE